jgi:hypothetical protein
VQSAGTLEAEPTTANPALRLICLDTGPYWGAANFLESHLNFERADENGMSGLQKSCKEIIHAI